MYMLETAELLFSLNACEFPILLSNVFKAELYFLQIKFFCHI